MLSHPCSFSGKAMTRSSFQTKMARLRTSGYSPQSTRRPETNGCPVRTAPPSASKVGEYLAEPRAYLARATVKEPWKSFEPSRRLLKMAEDEATMYYKVTMAMDLRDAVMEVLALPPTAHGQLMYERAHLAQVYFSGSWTPALIPRLHPRAHLVKQFTEMYASEEFNDPPPDLVKNMAVIVNQFPGFATFRAVDDLCFAWA